MAQAHITDFVTARRILILGVTGAGKSTAASRIAQVKEAQLIDYDEILWEPGAVKPWTFRSEQAQQELTLLAMETESWVMAAVSSAVEGLVIPQTDLIIYLDYPPRTTFTRLVKRTARRTILKEKCCNGNTESLPNLVGKDAIIAWWFKTYKQRHESALRLSADPALPKTLRLTRPGQLDLLLSQLSA